jgi:hypothetical protein
LILMTDRASPLLHWFTLRTHHITLFPIPLQHDAIHSILAHFDGLHLDPEATVEEANKRRTASYYLKAREAHLNYLVAGVGSMTKLKQLRQKEMDRILEYSRDGTKSHRTVVAMCDSTTASLLDEAREGILKPLNYSTDPSTPGVWIPELNIIPPKDLHITVCIPWWWHTIRDGNFELSKELASRLRQTLILKFHHPFQIECQRIVLLGGSTLVALWRCVGERVTDDGLIVYDRHGETVDPFVRLRVEVVRCFTTESPDNRRQPLTYNDIIRQRQESEGSSTSVTPTKPPQEAKENGGRPKLERQNSIELRTPGLGSGDGFIHTTLCRLPLDCLSQNDVSLTEVHRLCREATETLSGHRMVISKFRLLETVGKGGESNPCIEPIFDETIEAPTKYKVNRHTTVVNEVSNLHDSGENGEANTSTIGAFRPLVARPSLEGLFDAPETKKEEGVAPIVKITAPVLI